MTELFYKVLGPNQESHHGGLGKWVKNRWRTVDGRLEPCVNGIHFCRRDQLVHWLGPRIWLFEDGSPDETVEADENKMVTRKGRIVERVGAWNDVTARLFAADVAEIALRFIPESHVDPFVRAIATARGFARGEISDEERRSAARAANVAWAEPWGLDEAINENAAWTAARAARAAVREANVAKEAARNAAWAAAWVEIWSDTEAWKAGRAAAEAVQTDFLFQYLEGVRT